MVVIVVGVVGGGVIASHIGADVGCPCAPGFVGAHRVIIVVVVGVIGIICGCEFLIEFVLRVLDVAVGDNGGAQCIEHVVDDRVWASRAASQWRRRSASVPKWLVQVLVRRLRRCG